MIVGYFATWSVWRRTAAGRVALPEMIMKPQKCPECGCKRIAQIKYGRVSPTESLMAAIEAGRIVLGRLLSPTDPPTWQCTDCKTDFRKKDEPIDS